MRTAERSGVIDSAANALLVSMALITAAGCGRSTTTTVATYAVASGSTVAAMTEPVELPPGLPPVEELGERPAVEAASPDTPVAQAPAVSSSAADAVVQPAVDRVRELFPAESWPSFRNGSGLRGVATSPLPEKLELLWEIETQDGVQSTAAIDAGRVYIGTTEGQLLCLDLSDGREIWRRRSIESADPKDFAMGFIAPITLSPTIVYAGDEEGVLHAVSRETGKPLWKFPTNGLIKGGATLLPDGRVMIGSHGGHLYGLTADTGEQVWDVPTQGPVNGSQALAGQYTFVTGCDKPVLRIVDVAAGTQHAEATMNDPRDARNAFLLIASPAVEGDVLYFGTDGGEVVAFNWRKQEFAWINSDEERAGQIDSSPALTDQHVVIGTGDRRLLCLDKATGKERWQFETRGAITGSPVVVGERAFFGSADRNLYGVNIHDGAEVWKFNAGQRFSASPAVGEGRLVIGADQSGGKIYCFGAK
jgi:outer membrane protein assembly factor BamB